MITFNVVPVAKPRQTRSDKWQQRDCVVRYRAFADLLRLEANRLGFELPPSYHVVFYVPMPKSWSKKKRREMDGQPHQQKPDIDNLLKAFQDALAGDDSFVHTVTASKVWSVNGCINLWVTCLPKYS